MKCLNRGTVRSITINNGKLKTWNQTSITGAEPLLFSEPLTTICSTKSIELSHIQTLFKKYNSIFNENQGNDDLYQTTKTAFDTFTKLGNNEGPQTIASCFDDFVTSYGHYVKELDSDRSFNASDFSDTRDSNISDRDSRVIRQLLKQNGVLSPTHLPMKNYTEKYEQFNTVSDALFNNISISNGNGGTWQSKEILELIKTNFIHNTTNKIKSDANISVKNLKSKFGLENDSDNASIERVRCILLIKLNYDDILNKLTEKDVKISEDVVDLGSDIYSILKLMRKSNDLEDKKISSLFLNNLFNNSSLFTGYERVNRELWKQKDHDFEISYEENRCAEEKKTILLGALFLKAYPA